MFPNSPPSASLQSLCPSCHLGCRGPHSRRTAGAPPAAPAPSRESPLRKNPKVESQAELCNPPPRPRPAPMKSNDSPCCVFGCSFLSKTSCCISFRRSSSFILHESKASLTNSDTGGLVETSTSSLPSEGGDGRTLFQPYIAIFNSFMFYFLQTNTTHLIGFCFGVVHCSFLMRCICTEDKNT